MSFLSFLKPSDYKKCHIPKGTTAKDYAQSLLIDAKRDSLRINATTSIAEFQSLYEKISQIFGELIWLNEKKHISMSPTPRSNWISIQSNLPATINSLLDRISSQFPAYGMIRANAIDKLVCDIEQNEPFLRLFDSENRAKLATLKNEAIDLRKYKYSPREPVKQNRFVKYGDTGAAAPEHRAKPEALKNESIDVCGKVTHKVTHPPKEITEPNLFVKYGGADAALLDIDLMDGLKFEQWCADALVHLGFCNVERTPASGDHGVDILAKKDGVKYAIQCKRYTSDLGNKPIQEVHAGKALYHCHVGVVITNQHFTSGAVTLANATDTLLWDRKWIKSYLENGEKMPEPLETNKHTDSFEDDLDDPFFAQAVEVVLETGLASVSMIQRRLKLGYARAAILLDIMEERGLIGPFQGTRPRAILVTKEQWRAMNQ